MRQFILAVLLVMALLVFPVQATQAAIVTLPHSSFGGGIVQVNFDYNQGNGNVLRFRCINNSPVNYVWFGVFLCDYEAGTCSLVGERYCPPGETITQVVPGVTIAWDLVDGGLMMGNYQFRARYPATPPG